jgi:cytochrome subunit of sulfide dehydrogenase
MTHDKRAALGGLVAVLALAGSAPAAAQDAQRLNARALAATCAHCHGTDGHALSGEAMVKLAGLPADFTLTQLLAFRTGTRPATIMHQISRGYSQEQLEALAKYFAAQK